MMIPFEYLLIKTYVYLIPFENISIKRSISTRSMEKGLGHLFQFDLFGITDSRKQDRVEWRSSESIAWGNGSFV